MKRSGWLWLSPPSVAVSSAKNSPITRGLRPAHRQLYKYTLSQTSNISSLQSTIDSIQDSTVGLQLNTEDVRSYILAFYRLCVQSEEGLDPWPIFETSYFLSIWAIVDTKFDKSEHNSEMLLWVSPDWQRATLARKLQRFSFSSNTVPGEQLRTVAIQEPDLAPAWHDTHLQIFLMHWRNIFSVSQLTVHSLWGGRLRRSLSWRRCRRCAQGPGVCWPPDRRRGQCPRWGSRGRGCWGRSQCRCRYQSRAWEGPDPGRSR